MQEFVEYIVKKIANNPEEVQIREKEDKETIVMEIFLSEDDRDKIIGKEARIANALRIIVEEVARKLEKLVVMKISDNCSRIPKKEKLKTMEVETQGEVKDEDNAHSSPI